MPRIPLTMPKMSMTMEFGTVVEWLIQPGDTIRDGDAIVVVTTDKVDMDVEATGAGTLAEIIAEAGVQVPVGQPIAWIESATDDLLVDLFDAPAPAGVDTKTSAPVPDATAPAPDEAPLATLGTVRAVPLARKLAAAAGLSLAGIAPSGPSNTIRARDVRAALANRPQVSTVAFAPGITASTEAATASPATTPSTIASLAVVAGTGGASAPRVSAEGADLLGDAKTRRMRVATARVLESSALIPQFTAWRTFDLSRLAKARKVSLKGVSWTTLLLRAYALTLREYPQLNGFWAGEGTRPNAHVGIALAVDTPTGLVAPVLLDPDKMSMTSLDAAIKTIAGNAKAGTIDPDSLSGGTGTLSNLGSLGVDRFNAMLTPPQATALSLGTVGTRPVFDADCAIRAQTVCEGGLTLDHRAADGADGARAMQTIQDFLDDPLALLA